MENGKWKMGSWKLEVGNGKWEIGNGKCKLRNAKCENAKLLKLMGKWGNGELGNEEMGKCLEMVVNNWKCLEIVGNGWKWLEILGNGVKCLEILEIVGNIANLKNNRNRKPNFI